jgi:hypothetical protein
MVPDETIVSAGRIDDGITKKMKQVAVIPRLEPIPGPI